MKNETTYTSPLTGLTYEVRARETAGYLRWEILLDGRPVQFALSADGVSDSVRFLEVGDGVWGSRFD